MKKHRKLMKPFKALNECWEAFLARLPKWLSPWVRDTADVGATVLTIIIILRLLLGADMLVPLVVVTSQSMVHTAGDNSWISWLQSRGVKDNVISSFPLTSGFDMGDMMVVRDPKAVLGDVIIYERDLHHLNFSSTDPIIHRVVGVAQVKDYVPVSGEGTLDCFTLNSFKQYADNVRACQEGSEKCFYSRYPEGGDFRFFITKGDNNAGSDQCNINFKIAYPVNDAQVTGRAFLRLPMIGWPKLILSLIFRIITFQF